MEINTQKYSLLLFHENQEYFYRVNDIAENIHISRGHHRPTILDHYLQQGVLHVSVQTKNKILIHHILLQKDSFQLIKNHLDIHEIFPYEQVFHLNGMFYISPENKLFLLINIKGRVYVFLVAHKGLLLTCNLLGGHYLQLSCKEHL